MEPSLQPVEQVWDAIVVGAGPAGCAAAYDLAAAGRSVLLLDKKSFPRSKACAGGLTAKAVNALRYSIDPVVRQTIRRLRLEGESPAALPLLLKSRELICVTTVRADFDAYCLQKTRAAGAVFRTISPIQQIVRDGTGVRVCTAGQHFQARFVVGADGTSGQVRRLCAPGPWYRQGFALEVQAAAPPQPADLTFDFAAIQQGYAWIFPKHDHWNVGLYVQSSAESLTRSQLLRYVREKAGTEALDAVIGQYLGLGAGAYRADDMQQNLRDRVMLAGDAGGFADALTGEGIYGALLSGQAAAKAILTALRGEGSAEQAFAALLRDYRQTLQFSARAATAFYANPARGFRLMRLPFVRRTVVKTYTHGLNIKSLPMRLALACA